MHVYYGPYRALEQQFATYAAAFKPGAGRSVLVLCPSGRVAEYLRGLLVRQSGCISNVFFMTFSQLLAALDKESVSSRLPLLPGDSLHDYLLKNLLSKPGLDRYRISRGFVSALRSSLRDLGDALVNVDVLDEHLTTTTDPALLEGEAHWRWLVDVYRAYQTQMDQVPGYRSYQQYFQDALAQVETSKWLADFQEIWVYGFYELTGRQLELFQALRGLGKLAVFWPYTAAPAFTFGRKFFEANILGAATEATALQENETQLAGGEALSCLFTPNSAVHAPENLHFISAPDPEGELFAVVKKMLQLHEEQHIPFEDMAITARSLEAYKTRLPNMLAQNHIPLKADFTFSFSSRPLGVFLLNLLSLLRGGFDREDVLAVVTSPYFKHKNNWRYLIKECLAQRDYAQWTDLVRPTLSSYDPAFLAWLEKIKTQLEFLESAKSWDILCDAAIAFLQDNLDTEHLNAAEQTLWEGVQLLLDSLRRYQVAAAQAGEREFIEEFVNALQNWQQHQVYDQRGGVTVGEVTSLRGLSFEVVFALGINEKSFPQVISEDPVLKDYYRRILRDQLGFWINQKMERFDEERLLFFCMAEAARRQLYLSFLRADSEGKPLVPSGYLAELARAAKMDLMGEKLQRVSGQLTQRLQETAFTYLTKQEMSLALAAQSAPAERYEAAGLCGPQQQTALASARHLAGFGTLTAYDGAIASGTSIFEKQNEGGFSPSALQDLARCPMKYFLAKGIGLKEQEDVFSRAELAPNLRGTAYHTVLMDYYRHLYQEGLAGQLFPSALQARLDESLAKNYTAKSYKTFGIYPVIWELILQDIHDKLSAFVLQDAEQLGSYVPSIFETYFEKIYQPAPQLQMKLKGIIDRIDIDSTHKTFRVVDYKSGRHGGKDLSADMFKYVILQPFIYLILAQQEPQLTSLNSDGAMLLNINKGYAKQELTQARFETVRPRADEFLALLMKLICQGQFFINPGEHCEYCPYGAVCRKDSFRSRARAQHSALASTLQEAKK